MKRLNVYAAHLVAGAALGVGFAASFALAHLIVAAFGGPADFTVAGLAVGAVLGALTAGASNRTEDSSRGLRLVKENARPESTGTGVDPIA